MTGFGMTDGRRRRWVAHDAYFLDEALGVNLFDRFGAAGVALWFALVAACKRSHIEGEFRYGSTDGALSELGLPGMELVDPDGEPFTFDDFFDVLADHKVLRRKRMGGKRRRGGRGGHVVMSKWSTWQRTAARQRKAEAAQERRESGGSVAAVRRESGGSVAVDGSDPDDSRTSRGQNRRSEAENTGTVGPRSDHDGPLDTDTDTDTDKTPTSPPDGGGGDEHSAARELTREFATLVRDNGHPIPRSGTKSNATWLTEMDRLLRIGPPGWDGPPPSAEEISRVFRWAAADEFERAVVRSVPKFRSRYSQLRLKALASRPGPVLRAVGSHEHEDGTF